MILLLQRVREARVDRRGEAGAPDEKLGSVGKGFLALVCAEAGDTEEAIGKAARKTAQKTYPVEVVKYERISRLYTANI